jgi:hypothetical protein
VLACGSSPAGGSAGSGSSLARAAHAVPSQPVGFQNSVMGLDLVFYAARSYSLMRPLRTGRRLIRPWERAASGWSGRGGCNCRLRWGHRPL